MPLGTMRNKDHLLHLLVADVSPLDCGEVEVGVDWAPITLLPLPLMQVSNSVRGLLHSVQIGCCK